MKLTSMSRVNAFLDELLAVGWQIARSRKHLIVQPPEGGASITISRTAKDGRSTARNALALLKRKRREYDGLRGYGD